MAHRLARAGTALAIAAMLMVPGAASADTGHDHASPSADPHAGHDTGGAHDDHGTTAPESGGHDDHGTTAPESGGHDDHGTTTEDDGGGHTDHGTEPDSVSPEVRNLVLSSFAGVNAAVIFGAWMVRRTGPDPDPRKRAPKATP